MSPSVAPSVSPTIQWSPEPSVLIGVAAIAVLYLLGWRRGRATRSPHRPGFGRLTLFALGLLAILAALVSPIDALGDQLLVMHMLQHILLLDISPILLILGLNKVLLRPVTRRLAVVEQRAGYLAHPAFAVVAYVGFMWGWHIPALYDAALHNTTVHAFEHLCFAFAGTLYWWHLLSPIRARLRLGGMGPVVYMASTKLFVGALGMGLAFAPTALYSYYVHHARVWGISAHDDQSIAGFIMAVEQSLVMGVALVVLFIRALTESEREQQRRERFQGA